MHCNQNADPSGFFLRVSGLFFGTVHSTAVFNTPGRAAKALCGTIGQLLYMRANIDACSVEELGEEASCPVLGTRRPGRAWCPCPEKECLCI